MNVRIPAQSDHDAYMWDDIYAKYGVDFVAKYHAWMMKDERRNDYPVMEFEKEYANIDGVHLKRFLLEQL